jgi:DNA-binding transcriptional LysR family regulator
LKQGVFKGLNLTEAAVPGSVLRYKEFNLTQLRVFCEFLKEKSFSDTARAMGMSHSAVWQQVRALERRFGVSLLQRHGRTWQPTEDGEALFDLIAGLLHAADSLDDAFRQLRGELARELRVIATPGSAAGELAGPVAEIKRRHPSTRVRISLGSSLEQTVEELLAGTTDVAVLTGSMIGRLQRASLQVIPLRERSAGALVPVRHPLARRDRLSLEDLIAHPLIVPTPAFSWRQRCDEVFREAGLLDQMQISVEVSLIQAIEEFVRRKVGVGLSPLVPGWRPGPGVVVLPAAHLFPADELVLLRRRGKPRSQAQLLEELLLRTRE